MQSPPHQPVLAKGMGTLVAGVGSWSRLIFLEVSFRALVQVLPSLPAPRRGVWHSFLSHAGADSLCGPLLSPGSQQEGCFSLDTSARFAPLAGEKDTAGDQTQTLSGSVGWRARRPFPKAPAAGRTQLPKPLQQDKTWLVLTAESILQERGTAQEVAHPPPAPHPSLPSSDRAANRMRLSPGGLPLISVA